jgi:cytochrome P450
MEETLRLGTTTGRINRLAKVDAEVLGYTIPAGTDIVMSNTIFARPVAVPEHLRSPSSRAAFEKRGRPGIEGPAGDDLPAFKPERWLAQNETGDEVFDAYALPRLAFGDGPRGCFGMLPTLQDIWF